MNFIKSSFRVSLLLLLYSLNTCHGVPMVESMKLYKDTDPIVQMTVVDFKTTIVETSNAWLIEFYSSWCGHCIDFAPTFIELANDVKGKSPFIHLQKLLSLHILTIAFYLFYRMGKGDKNWCCRLCTRRKYPTVSRVWNYGLSNTQILSFFYQLHLSGYTHERFQKSAKHQTEHDWFCWETIWRKERVSSLACSWHSPVCTLFSYFYIQKCKTFIYLFCRNETLADLWAHYNNDEIILLFESEETKTKNEYWSREAILDASYRIPLYPPIRRVGASERQDLVEKYNVKSLPAFVFLERSGKSELYDIQPSRLFLAKVMHKFFHPDGQDSAMTTLPTTTKGSGMIAANNAPVASSDKEDRVYMVDIEGAVLYAFGHEVSMHKSIAGKELAALKELVHIYKFSTYVRLHLLKHFDYHFVNRSMFWINTYLVDQFWWKVKKTH